MKRICFLLVTIGLAALSANAQTVTGSRSTNTIPKFTGSSIIGDSQIHQIDDNIGINTDFIVGTLSVFESRDVDVNPFFPQPYAIYGNISTGTNSAAGVRGHASSPTGSASPDGGIALSFLRTDPKANERGPQLKKNPLFAPDSRGTRTSVSRNA